MGLIISSLGHPKKSKQHQVCNKEEAENQQFFKGSDYNFTYTNMFF